MTLEKELQNRLENLKALPSPPRVAMRILAAARDPDVRLAQVADVVTADPVITAKIMRTANSAVYARPGGCTTLRQALVLLGLDATLIIALSFSLVMNLRRDRSDGVDHELYWRRSLLAATGARALGNALGRHDGEALFLGALLQDIGMLAVEKLDPTLYASAGESQRDHRKITAHESAGIGADHAAVGAWLMQRWQLPAPIVNAIAASHDPLQPDSDAFCRCVAMSGPLADVWMASDWSYSFRELVALAVESLGMDHVQLGMVLDELRQQIPETEAMFEKDLIDPGEEFVALEEARELLMTRGVDGYMRAACIEQTRPHAGAIDAPVTLLQPRHRDEVIEALQRERAAMTGGCATLMIARLDRLEQARRRLGDGADERILRTAATVMLGNSSARVVGQYDDAELALWLTDTSAAAATLAAARVEKAFAVAIAALTGDESAVALDLGWVAVDAAETRDMTTLIDAARQRFTRTQTVATRSRGTAELAR